MTMNGNSRATEVTRIGCSSFFRQSLPQAFHIPSARWGFPMRHQPSLVVWSEIAEATSPALQAR